MHMSCVGETYYWRFNPKKTVGNMFLLLSEVEPVFSGDLVLTSSVVVLFASTGIIVVLVDTLLLIRTPIKRYYSYLF